MVGLGVEMSIFSRLWGRVRRGVVQLASLRIVISDKHQAGWTSLRPGGPSDRAWGLLQRDLVDVLEAWRTNFLVRQIVRLTTAYVVGDGIKVTSEIPEVETFIKAFWGHEENKMDTRLPAWCDELTRAGEIFPVLFTNRVDGMSYVRMVPASQIVEIKLDPEDYEKELEFGEARVGTSELKYWKSKRTARASAPGVDGRRFKPEPVMLHYTINKPVGSTRGEGDLMPVLPWVLRYTEWLKDRVRFNRIRTELAAVDIEVSDDSLVGEKREQYEANPPVGGALVVHGPGEKITYPAANIQAYDAEPDGKAQRLAIAAGVNLPIHFLAEGSSATRSTASEMGDPTHRHFRMRQQDFAGILVDLCLQAWRRYERANGLASIEEPLIKAVLPDISRADNSALAGAAASVVGALATMKAEGWVTDAWAVKLAFQFAGEILSEQQINSILAEAASNPGAAGKDKESGSGTKSTNPAGGG
jgi:hypothetical protein